MKVIAVVGVFMGAVLAYGLLAIVLISTVMAPWLATLDVVTALLIGVLMGLVAIAAAEATVVMTVLRRWR